MSEPLLDVLRAVRLIEATLSAIDATAPAVTDTSTAAVPPMAARAGPGAIEVLLPHLVTSGSGWSALVDHMVEVVRRRLSTLAPEGTTWLGGLRDEAVGRALGKLHDRPAHDWTLRELARQAGMSRSALAGRFEQSIGVPPMRYLARWRIQLAAALLSSTAMCLAEIAERVGYGSEAALSRAFKRLVGVAPARWRSGSPPARSSARGSCSLSPHAGERGQGHLAAMGG